MKCGEAPSDGPIPENSGSSGAAITPWRGPSWAICENVSRGAALRFAAPAQNAVDISAQWWAWSCEGPCRNSAPPWFAAFLHSSAIQSGSWPGLAHSRAGKTQSPILPRQPSGESQEDPRTRSVSRKHRPGGQHHCNRSTMNMALQRLRNSGKARAVDLHAHSR